jgi:hypothetical protein
MIKIEYAPKGLHGDRQLDQLEIDKLRDAVLTRPSMGACVVPSAILAVEAVRQASWALDP